MRLRNIPSARQELAESPYVIGESDLPMLRGRWSELFGNDHPLRIEIGMGKGQFLLELARREPKVNFIGIERYSSVLVHPVRRLKEMTRKGIASEGNPDTAQEDASTAGRPAIAQEDASTVGQPAIAQEDASTVGQSAAAQEDASTVGQSAAAQEDAPLRNIFLLRMDAERLTEVFAPGEVDRIYLNFSDPWPKDRHAKRRLPGRVFLGRYAQILIPEGRVEFKTDNRSLFDFALEEAKASGWIVDAFTYDLHHDPVMNEGNILTEYEKRFSEAGNPICKLIERPLKDRPGK